MLHLQKLDQEMSNYIGQIQTVKEELAELLPITANIEAQELQRDKFFMLLTLAGLPSTLASIRDHLASPMVPSMEDVFARCCMFLCHLWLLLKLLPSTLLSLHLKFPTKTVMVEAMTMELVTKVHLLS